MRINALGNTATDFASDDYIAIDGTTNASRKMKNDDLLKVTAQNALAENVAPAFDTGKAYFAGESVTYNGTTYVFKVDHLGGWNSSEVVASPHHQEGTPNIILGQYSLGNYSSSSNRCCCVLYGINTFACVSVSEGMSFRVGFRDSDGVNYLVSSEGLVTNGNSKFFKQIKLSDYAPANVTRAYLIFKNDDDSDLVPSDVYKNLRFGTGEFDTLVYLESGAVTMVGVGSASFVADSTSIRSYIPNSVKYIKASKGYKFRIIAFDGTYWKIFTSTGWASFGTSMFMDYLYLDEVSDQSLKKYFVVVKNEDNSNMSDDDLYSSLEVSSSVNDHTDNGLYFNQGEILVTLGNGQWNYSNLARSYARINTNFVKAISVSKDFSFRLVAVDNNGTYYIRSYDSWSTFGNSLFFKECDLLDLLDNRFKAYYIVVKKDDGSNISPLDVNDAILVSDYSKHNDSVSLEYNNFALAYDRHPIATDSIPANIGIVCHKLDGDDGSIWYSDSLTGLKKFAVLNSSDIKPKDCMIAMSPSLNTLILTQRGVRGTMYVVKDGITFELFSNAATKPMGWLYNSGVEFVVDGNGVEHCIFAEYTGTTADSGQLHVWRGTAPYTNESDWEIVKSVNRGWSLPDLTGTITHFHQVRRDPWSDIIYLTSGDKEKQLNWWYSEDFGETWQTLIADSDVGYSWEAHVLRIINFIFTKDFIYFATDHGTNHSLSKIQRDNDGLIDISTRVKLCDLPDGHATNSICLNQYPYGIFLYDRIDTGYPAHNTDKVKMQFWDIENAVLKDIVDLPLVSPQWGGSRGKCYLEYTSLRFPHPMMGFSDDTRCIFDVAVPVVRELGTIVYDVATSEVTDIQ